jgi:signal transduction histidine kinase
MRRRILRHLGNKLHPVLPQMSLSQRFFWTALSVVVVAMLVLGNWTSDYVSDSIAPGVGGTAAARIEALVSRSLDDQMNGGMPMSDRRTELDEAFEIGSNAESTRLLQIRIRDLQGDIRYASLGGLRDETDTRYLQAASQGHLFARVLDLPLQSVGTLPERSLAVLKIYTPLRRVRSDEIFAVGELYFSARSVRELQARAQSDVWIICAMIGYGAIGTLALLVDVTGNIITRQRTRLARNLRQTRQLMLENARLNAASEKLRLDASLANENVLAQVGSDIHDGPVQLLTLLILRLTSRAEKARGTTVDAATLATEAMEDLRGISAGLVLPELAKVGLAESLLLAVTRHESLTGTSVRRVVNASGDAAINAKVCAYRVVQEALNNAHRHGGGVNQVVRADTAEGWLNVEVTNKPKPSARTGAASADQIGLRAMRFRVEALGGTLSVELGPNLARVVARIPLNQPGQLSMPSGTS